MLAWEASSRGKKMLGFHGESANSSAIYTAHTDDCFSDMDT